MRKLPAKIDHGRRTVRKTSIALVLFALAACGRVPPKAEAPAPTQEQTPEEGYAGQPESSPASAQPIGEGMATAGSVEAPERVNMDAAEREPTRQD
jgi:predicted small lipoprotein YifL